MNSNKAKAEMHSACDKADAVKKPMNTKVECDGAENKFKTATILRE